MRFLVGYRHYVTKLSRNTLAMITGVVLTFALQAAELGQPKLIAGDWQGVYQCSGYAAGFDLQITQVDGQQITAVLSRKLYGPNGKVLGHSQPPTVSMSGRYLASKGHFALETNRTARPRTALNGVIDPTTQRIAAQIVTGYEKNCSYAIAGKNRAGTKFKTFARSHRNYSRRSRATPAQSCPGDVTNWLSQPLPLTQYTQAVYRYSRYGALEFFTDDKFVPFFGKPFGELSNRDVLKLASQVRGPCWSLANKIEKNGRIGSDLLGALGSTSLTDVLIYPEAKAIIRNWRDAAIAGMDTQSQQQVRQLTQLGAAVLPILWPIEEYDIRPLIANKQNQQGAETVLAQLEQMIEQRPYDFSALQRLVSFGESVRVDTNEYSLPSLDPQIRTQQRNQQQNRRRSGTANTKPVAKTNRLSLPQVSAQTADEVRTTIRTKVNEQIRLVLPAYLAPKRTPQAVREQLRPINSGGYASLAKYLNPDTTQWFDEAISKARHTRLQQFARNERTRYDNTAAIDDVSLATLQTVNSFESQFRTEYADLWRSTEFAEFNSHRVKHRKTLLEGNATTIAEQLSRAIDMRQLDATRSSYLQANTVGVVVPQPIQRAYQQRRKQLRPFDGYPGQDFLNAVYTGDMTAVRRYNRAYSAEMQQRIRGFLGAGDPRAQGLGVLASYASLSTPMLATYLFSYEKEFGSCLTDRAVDFRVTTTVPGTSISNLLGVEISRTYGYTQITRYRVNPEFVGIFREIGKTNPGGFFSLLSDQMLSRGQVASMRSGIKKMMSEYQCDSAVVKQMETHMRSAYGAR